jgi:hypothetical protein
VFVGLEPVDMRGSFDSLAGAARRLGLEPTDGHLYLFVKRHHNGTTPAPTIRDHPHTVVPHRQRSPATPASAACAANGGAVQAAEGARRGSLDGVAVGVFADTVGAAVAALGGLARPCQANSAPGF